MTDYKGPDDFFLRYEDKAPDARLVFAGGTRVLVIQATEEVQIPPEQTIGTAAELADALATGKGAFRVKAGTYAGNFVAKAPDATFHCEPGVALTAAQVGATLSVKTNNFKWYGGVFTGTKTYETIACGSTSATSLDAQPNGVLFSGTALTAPAGGAKRGFSLHGQNITIDGCAIYGYYLVGQDSQGVWINNGPGPYTIRNSYIEGGAENILVGGDSIRIKDCVPSDILVEDNWIHKPEAWKTIKGIVKNSFELKAGQRVTVRRNLLDGNWPDAQAGHQMALTPRNPNADSPWITVEDVVIDGNKFSNSRVGYAINVLGRDSTAGRPTLQTQRLTIMNNLFEHSTGGIQISLGVVENLTIDHNTFPAITGSVLLFADTGTKTALNMTRNALKSGAYCVFAQGASGVMIPALTLGCSTYTFTDNLIERTSTRITTTNTPPGNTLAANGSVVWTAPDYPQPATGWSDGEFPSKASIMAYNLAVPNV